MHLQNMVADEVFVIREPTNVYRNYMALDQPIVPIVDYIAGVGRIKNIERPMVYSTAN